MSGGTRCNITHDCDNRGIVAAYGTQGKFLHSPLAALSVERTIELFHDEGVTTKVEEGGKVFPVSNRAADVLDALLCAATRTQRPRRWHLARARSSISARSRRRLRSEDADARASPPAKVILTTGGQSYPGSGTTGDGYALCENLGHTIVPPRPALVPITVNVPWLPELRGLTMPDVSDRHRRRD